jgi:glycosyltransferase involved in cell wall biosynthesis
MHENYGGIDKYQLVEKCFVRLDGFTETLTASAASRSLMERLRKPDFVHIHGMWRPLLLGVAHQCRSAQIPYGVTPHGMLTRWAMSQKSIRKRAALSWRWRSVLNHAAFIHYLNEHERDESEPASVSCLTVVLPNGVSLQEVAQSGPARGDVLARIPPRYILFLARLGYYKGLDLLVAAFAQIAEQLPDVHLAIAGPDFGYEETLRRLIVESGLSNRIHVLGGVYGPDKMHLLRGALCLCHPTRHEGFSMTLLEALAAAIPVVTTVNANFPEIAAFGAGVVTATSVAGIASGLMTVLLNNESRLQMGQMGLRLAKERYEWSVIAAALANSYTSTCAHYRDAQTSSAKPARVDSGARG